MAKILVLAIAVVAAAALGGTLVPAVSAESPPTYGAPHATQEQADWASWISAPAATSDDGVTGSAGSVPVPTFRIPDPSSDTFGFETFQPNITAVTGLYTDVLPMGFVLTVEFSGPVFPADAGNSMEVVGLIDFDTDVNPATGAASAADTFCPGLPNMQGSDVIANLGAVAGGQLPLFDSSTVTQFDSVPITFGGTSFSMLIPLDDLGDDQTFDMNMVLGSFPEPTDCAGNGINIHCSHGACTVGPQYPACEAIGKDGFELGAVDTNVAPCWTVADMAGGMGSWCMYAGTVAPLGDCALPGTPSAVEAPPQGNQAIMTNTDSPGSHVLYRCGTVLKGGLSFQLYLNSQSPDYFVPSSLNYDFDTVGDNQQFRVDIVTTSGMAGNPFTLAGGDILTNVYQTDPGDPLVAPYTVVTADLSSYVGQNVCLRFAEVDNAGFFNVGIDQVIFPTKVQTTDTDSDGCLNVLENGIDEAFGGRRSFLNFWDFFDTPDAGNVRDSIVSIGDVFRVVGRFGTFGDVGLDPLSMPPATGYHTAFDRSPPIGEAWDLQPPDGSIAVGDIFSSVQQFGHTCVVVG